MNKQKKLRGLGSFPVFDLILLAMITGLSIAFKVVVSILVKMVTGPLGIPGGALAGGLYMLWLPLAITLTNRRGSAFIVAVVQAVVLITTGLPGSHGFWTILTYLPPAIAVELIYIYVPKKGYNVLHYLASTMLANIVGTYASNLVIFRLSLIPLLFTLLASLFSGAMGGIIAYFTYALVEKTGLLKNRKKKRIYSLKKMSPRNELEIIKGEEADQDMLTEEGVLDKAEIEEESSLNLMFEGVTLEDMELSKKSSLNLMFEEVKLEDMELSKESSSNLAFEEVKLEDKRFEE